MSMKFTQLVTYWQAEDALQMIDFLDQLRDKLWENHLDEIEKMYRDRDCHNNDSERQYTLFDDDIEF